MSDGRVTREHLSLGQPPVERRPGALAVFSVDRPLLRALPLAGGEVVLGRADDGSPDPIDELASRQHARVSHALGGWRVADLGSRNGTFVNGQPAAADGAAEAPHLVRTGYTLYLLQEDLRRFEGASVTADEQGVVGPTLAEALARVRHAAAAGGDSLLLTGESGTGKERAARAFHAAGPHAAGPFVAVNCAAIPEGIAERLLFGAQKGAYSGATADAPGYLQAADGGVLFLDEIGELDPAVQPKLLRALEAREVLPLGAARAQPVSARICFATHANLRAKMAAGELRADLYFRIARAEVTLPPLRERREEIPHLIAWTLARQPGAPAPHARLVEACLLRTWPGNARELASALERAADEARRAGSPVVRPEHLAPSAGLAGDEEEGAAAEPRRAAPTEEDVRRAIEQHAGNLSAVARALGLHRSQLYRLLKRLGIEQG